MKIRRAEKKDVGRINELLSQVLEIHAKLRPDLFISGTRKYTNQEIESIIADDHTPVFAAVDDSDTLMGYAFCMIKEPVKSNNMPEFKSLYIDDLCVDEDARGEHIGSSLYGHVCAYAREIGCYNVTLNVWEGNDAARAFYEEMGFKVQKTVMEKIL